MPTLTLVRNLLKNYQEYKAQTKMLKSNQIELNQQLKEHISQLEQQLFLLDISIECLNTGKKQIIQAIYVQGLSLEKYARKNYLSKSNAFYRKEQAVKDLVRLYDSLTGQKI